MERSYLEIEAKKLVGAKKEFDRQLCRFGEIMKKEVVSRKRTTRRGVIVTELLVEISDSIYNLEDGYRVLFEACYNAGNSFGAWNNVHSLTRRLDGYKKETRRRQLSWYGRLG